MSAEPDPPPRSALPSRRETPALWWRIGFTGFGGPAGQISMLHREVVDQRGWVDERRFAHALSFCMLLPGPEAQQLATYLGWMLGGVRGGIVAGTAFIAPGAVLIGLLAGVYRAFGDVPAVAGSLLGLQAAVVVVVVSALLRIGRRTITGPWSLLLATVTFALMVTALVPFPLLVIGAGVLGWLAVRRQAAEPESDTEEVSSTRARTALIAGLTATAAWAATVIIVLAALPGTVWAQLTALWAQAALVTFGGAYAVLGYVAEQAVDTYGWVSAADMASGLALAETTPGPLILVLEYVGFLAAASLGAGALSPLAAGAVGAMLTLWVLFVPSFAFIFLGAPHVERLRGNRALRGALMAISAAVVGVIGALAVWFAQATFFTEFSWTPVVIAAVAGVMLLARRALLLTLAVSGLLGLLAAVAGI